jgi:protein-tyrosine sulfotransferase
MTVEKMDNAMRLYFYYIMNEHVRPAERLCAKDPNILYHINYLDKLFPNSKFVWLVRDQRAVVFSLMNIYKEPITMANATKYFITWQRYNSKVKSNCDQIGTRRCMMVKYEDLILSAKETIAKVAKFLNLTWTDNFLKREIFTFFLPDLVVYSFYLC